MAELIKKLSFKLARAGELVGREAARRLGLRFVVVAAVLFVLFLFLLFLSTTILR